MQPPSRRITVAGALALVVGAAALGYALSREAERRPAPWRSNSCRDAVSTPRFARPIAAGRPLVSRLKSAFGAPGLQVAVAVDGTVVWSRLCGFASVADRTPTSRTTLFRIGSVSKVFTATALARLVQAGTVDLDARVQRYVPSFPQKSGSITIARLASHQAGIRHYQGGEALNTVHYDSVAAALRVFATDPLLFPPGSDYGYSSYGFNLLGAALERAGRGRLRPAACDAKSCHRSRCPTRGSTLPPDEPLSTRSGPIDVRVRRHASISSDRYPSGGLLSTAEELARLGSRLGDPDFLTPATQAAFFRERRPTTGRPTGYGLGFETGRSPLGRFVGHTGNVVGGTAFLLAHPDSGVAIAMTTNMGWVTVATPPEVSPSVPDPPELLIPFIEASRRP